MYRVRFAALAVVAIIACTVVLGSSSSGVMQSRAADDRLPKSYARLVEAARATYELVAATYDAGKATHEDVYLWSRRLMEAELKADPADKSAAIEHGNRMRKLHEQVAKLHEAGRRGGEIAAVYATRYYVAEAEQL